MEPPFLGHIPPSVPLQILTSSPLGLVRIYSQNRPQSYRVSHFGIIQRVAKPCAADTGIEPLFALPS